jgi:hypothetical protein
VAVVLAGMTLSQIVSLIASLASAAKDIQSVHDELKAAGHPPDAVVPVASEIRVRQAMSAAQAQIDWDSDHQGG